MDKVILILTLCLIGQVTLVPLAAEDKLQREGPPVENSDNNADIDVQEDKYDVPANPSPSQAQEEGNSNINQEERFTKSEVKHENEQPPELKTQDNLNHQGNQPTDTSNEDEEDPHAYGPETKDFKFGVVKEGLRPSEAVQTAEDATENLAEKQEGQDDQLDEMRKPVHNLDARQNEQVEGAQGIPVDQDGPQYQWDDPLGMRPTAQHEELHDIKEDREDQQEHVDDRQYVDDRKDDDKQAPKNEDGNIYDNQEEYHSNEEVKPAQDDNLQEDQKYLGDRLMEPETEWPDVYTQNTEPTKTEPTPPVQEETKYNEDERDFSKYLVPEQEVQYQEDSQHQQESEYQERNTHVQQDTQQYEDQKYETQNEDSQNQNDDTQPQEDNTQYQEDNTQYQKDNTQYQEDNTQYQEDNTQYQGDNTQYQEDNTQYQEDNTQYQEEKTQHQEENTQHQEENTPNQEENAQLQEENIQYREQTEPQMDNPQEYNTESIQGQEDFKAEEVNQYQEEVRGEQPEENVQYHEEEPQQQQQEQETDDTYHLQKPQEQEVQVEPLVEHVRKEGTPLPSNPNIVIFLADGISRAAFVAGESLVPNLMKIAEEGVYFSEHMAGGLTDMSSRAALMTGRLAVRYGMALDGEPDVISTLASQSGLPTTETTFASVLQEKGYTTALIGKWNLGMSCESLGDLCHHPNNHGFDHYFGMPLVNHNTFASKTPKKDPLQTPLIITAVAILLALVLRRIIGTVAVFIMAVSVLGVFGWTWFCIHNPHIWSNAVMRNGEVVEQPADMERMAERMVKEGVRFLRTAKADNKPFLLVLSTLGTTASQGEDDNKARLQELDQGVGEVLSAVQELGLGSNTITYFTSTPHVPSDNQEDTVEGVNSPLVPGLLRWPSVLPAGLVVRASTSHLDVMPTLVQVAGGTLQGGWTYDGRSLLPRLSGGLDIPPPLFLYCGATPHFIKHTSTDGKVYVAHLFPPQWAHDAAAPYCKPQPAPSASRVHAEQPDTLTIYELSAGVDGINDRIPHSHPIHHTLLRTFTTLLEEHRYQLEEPVQNQFTWYKQSWHAYLQPKCANTQEYTCTDNDNALHEPNF